MPEALVEAISARPPYARLSRRAFLLLALGPVLLGACTASPKPTVKKIIEDEDEVLPKEPAQPLAAKPQAGAPAVVAGPNPGVSPGLRGLSSAAPAPQPTPQPTAQSARQTTPYTNRVQNPERLTIPSIDLESKVIPIGTKLDKDGKLIWETAAFVVGYHQGTGKLGEPGNMVLSGHISSPREGAVFSRLPQVKVGDGVIIGTSDRQFLYKVQERKVVTPAEVQVLDPTPVSVITLITCVPDGVYSHRLIVRAESV